MDYPMRVYGLNLFELFLSDILTALGWLMLLFALAAGLWPGILIAQLFWGGVLVAATAVTGIVQLMASTGLRQNRASLDLSYLLFLGSGIGWTASGLFPLRVAPLAAGIVMLLLFVLAVFVRRLAVQARFKPRFFSLRQFETLIQIADTMIDADGGAEVQPIETAIRVDHLLAELDSPTKEDIRTAVILVEWVLPILIFRPIPFSDLGSHERRRLVEQLIETRGPLRTICRTAVRSLKVLATVGYYGSQDVVAQVGYVPFERRERSSGVDQTPNHYPDPFL